jgi:choline dehydrogenase-like flavoprotein
MLDATFAASQFWDVIIVGTGIGGATVGRSLALRGLSVLFLEKGSRVKLRTESDSSNTPESRMADGWWPHPISREQPNGDKTRFFAAIGCAVGGSSIHYAAALERMAASDFDDLRTQGSSNVSWPVSFAEFLPYYEAAEGLYGLKAESNDVAEQRMSDWDRGLMDLMRKNGLRPDPLHVAIRYDDQCKECIGTICPRECKSDARVACLEEALRQTRCAMLENCDVQTLEADESRVNRVVALHKNCNIALHAKSVVLSAGAFHTPQILLRSRSDFWPYGLANSSGQVGRNLMFHTSDIFALWSPRRLDRHARQRKSISIRDFYLHQGERLGYVQSMGLEAGRGEISVYIKDQLRRRGLHNEFLLSVFAKAPSLIGAWLFGGAGIFAAMTEDDPNPNNRIILDSAEPDGISFSYTINDDLRRRADALRLAFSRAVRPWRMLRISTELEMNYGHPCGTCRFGRERASSVLDRDCRTHDLENLYIVDASFMPRSGAINPSLTIAANALRVAPQIAARLSNTAAQESLNPTPAAH